MEKNRITILLGVAAALVIIVFGILWFLPKGPEYSKEPSDWIDKKIDGTQKVDIVEATEGRGFYNVNSQQFRIGLTDTAFGYSGVYNGDFFNTEYYDALGILKMAVTPELNAYDGVIEGIIVEKIEDDKLKAYIFIDEDFKRALSEVNVVWGSSYQNIKPFSFNTVKPGIYMDSVFDDMDRFSYNYGVKEGGIIVGNVPKGGIPEDSTTAIILN